ncbi:TrgA family protein [Roseinatronobacter bogoriensis]|uniref:Tellurium resistance protein n=1 Tax=Roseinatronobacter bogoriensis subsp. barguzinensis TaxID=441209 RepID=A0A2K8K9W1_9RHOB|nr:MULTISPECIES: TrgA family protein [Rhodobaca]ATX66251.1 hypothetical protein BG454_10865 [Rhodobaca barguzinensis]MBB4207369.1 small-conductance mechanosensitive channel [Rhodobaca bogoriensis DSM 18756]TDW40324.1 hypothetical protein LY39_01358 [Rhodobaca barguzinensis]TDY70524.1 hypothetical protein EV660_102199 [Rhodobaca bogoriensis DSM 18756]
MPTLTRLLAFLLFGGVAYFLASKYQGLSPEFPESQTTNLFFAVVAACVGWTFVGRRITSNILRSVFVVLQGYIATFLLALAIGGLYQIFARGYQMRYRSFGDALEGSANQGWSILQQISTVDFVTVILGSLVAISLCLSFFFRIAEARRLSQ